MENNPTPFVNLDLKHFDGIITVKLTKSPIYADKYVITVIEDGETIKVELVDNIVKAVEIYLGLIVDNISPYCGKLSEMDHIENLLANRA